MKLNRPVLKLARKRNQQRASRKSRKPSVLAGAIALAAFLLPVAPVKSATLIFDSDADGSNSVNESGGTFSWTSGTTTTFINLANPTTEVFTANNITTDIAQFGNGGVLNSVATINVGTGSITGLIFGATLGNGYALTNTAPSVLTLGASGIVVNAGAQNTTVGDATNLSLSIGAVQTWNNGSASALNIAGNVADSGNFTLTLNASAAGAINFSGGITGAPTSGITVNSTGTGIVTLSGNNTETGATTLTAGTLRATTNAGALGAGALTLTSGTLILADDTGLNFGRNTTVGGSTTIITDRLTAGAGVNQTLGTLSMGAFTLTVNAGNLINATGTTGVTFGATTVGTNAVVFETNNSFANASIINTLTLGSIVRTTGSLTVRGTGNTTITGGDATATTGVIIKNGAGTLTLGSAGGATYAGTGAITINGGTVAVGSAAGGAATTFSGTRALTFGSANTGGGTFNLISANTGAASQTMGVLSFLGGNGTVQSTFTSGATSTTLTFASLAARTTGATGNFVVTGGTAGTRGNPGTLGTNTINFTASPGTGLIGAGAYFYNGSDFAYYDSAGFVGAPVYDTDAGFNTVAAAGTLTASSVNQITTTSGTTGTVTVTGATVVNGLKFAGATTLATGTNLVTTPSILVTGGAANITGTGGITTGGATDLIIRVDGATDSLTISSTTPITSTTTGGLAKTGAGTLTLSGTVHAYTGNIYLNEGVLAVTTGGSTNTPFGLQIGSSFRQMFMNGGTFRPLNSFNDNTPSATNVGLVFNFTGANGTFDIPTGVTLTLDDGSGTGTGSGASELQGSGDLIKTGPGTLSLGNAVTNFSVFTGRIFINAGSLTFGTMTTGNNMLGSTAANTVIASGANLNLNGLVAAANAAEPLTISGTGISGAGVITNGSATAAFFNGPITLAANSTVGLGANSITLSGGIGDNADNFALTVTGTGTLTLSGPGTYGGGTTLTGASTLRIGNASALGSGALTVNAANTTITANGASGFVTTNAVTLNGDTTFGAAATNSGALTFGALNLGGATRTITVLNPSGTPITFGGAVTNGTGLTLAGTGTLALPGTGSFTGPVTVNAGGTLSVGATTLNAVGSIVVGTTVTSGLNFNADNIGAATNLAANATVTLGGASSQALLGFQLGSTSFYDSLNLSGASGNMTVGAAGAVVTPVALTGFGAGTYNLITTSGGGTITGFGNISLNSAALPTGYAYVFSTAPTLVSLGVTAATGTNYYWTPAVGGGNMSWNGSSGSTYNWSVDDPTGGTNAGATPGATQTVNFSATNAGAAPIITTLDQNFSVLGVKFLNSGTGAATVNQGTFGTLTIGTGGITVDTGAPATATINAPIALGASQTWTVTDPAQTLSIQAAAPANGIVSGAFGVTLAGAGTVSLGGFNTFTGGVTKGATVTLNINNGGSTTTNSALGTGAITIAGGTIDNTSVTAQSVLTTGAQTWQGNITFTGTKSLHLGTGTVNLGTSVRTLTVNGGSLQIGGIMSGAGAGLIKAGTGTLTLSGANTFTTGGVTLNNGRLNINATAALGTGTFVINNTGTGVTVDNTTGGSLSPVNVQTWSSSFTFGGSAPLTFTTGAIAAGSTNKTITVNGPGLGINTNALTISSAITSTGGFTKAGSGSLVFNNANAGWTAGNLTINAGTVSLNVINALGNSTPQIIINGGAIDGTVVHTATNAMQWNSSFAFIGTGSMTLPGGITAAAGTTTVTALANTLTLGGIINNTNTPAITINGGGAVAFTGANTYTGATTVNPGGSLNLGAAGANGSITGTGGLVLNGGQFTYTRTGSVTQSFAGGLTIGPGRGLINTSTTTQTLNFNAITRNVGGTVEFQLFAGSVAPTTTNANVNGILGGYATIGSGANWAAGSGAGPAFAIGAYGAYTASIAGTTAPGSGTNVDFQASNTTPWLTQDVNSLRFNTAAATTLTMDVGQTLTLSSGGILITPTAAGNASTITGGTILGSASGDLIINHWGTTGVLNINSVIADNGGATGLTKSGTGISPNGVAVIGGSLGSAVAGKIVNTFTGNVYVNAGTLQVNSSSATGGNGATGALNSRPIILNGGTLSLKYDDSIGNAAPAVIALTNSVTVNGNATILVDRLAAGNPIGGATFTSPLNKTIQLGTLNFGNDGRTLTVTSSNGYGLEFTGTTTLDKNLTTITANTVTGSNVVQALTLSGKVTGSPSGGVITKSGTGVLMLTNATNDFVANIVVAGNGALSFNSDAALGDSANTLTLNGTTIALRPVGGSSNIVVTSSSTGSNAVTVVNPARLFVGYSLLGSTITAVNGNSITLAGNANQTIASATSVDSPLTINTSRTINLWGTTLANNIIEVAADTVWQLNAAFGSNNGPVTKSDLGIVVFNADNDLWAGQLSISAGAVRVTNSGALGISTSASAGNTIVAASGGALQLAGVTTWEQLNLTGTGINSGGALQAFAGTTNTTNGLITLSGAATIGADAGATLHIRGGIAGAQALTFGGAGTINVDTTPISAATTITKLNDGTTTIMTANPAIVGAITIYDGTLALGGGVGSVGGLGTITVNAGSTLTVDNSAGFGMNNRLGAAMGTRALSLVGGAFNYIGNASSSSSETLGAVTFTRGGLNTITVTAGAGAGTSLIFGAPTRTNGIIGGTALFRGTNLGSAPGAGVATIASNITGFTFVGAGGVNTVTKGIIPWALVDASASGTGTSFATADTATGNLRALNSFEYVTSLASLNSASNIVLGASNTLVGSFTVNSLTLNSGGGVAINPMQTLTIGGGNNVGGILAQSGNGNISGGLLTTGATSSSGGDMVFHTNGNLTVDSVITGTVASAFNALTKSGSGTLTLNKQNPYIGTTNIAQGTLKLAGGNNTIFYSAGNSYLGLGYGGFLDLNGTSQLTVSLYTDTFAAVNGSGGTVIGGAGSTLVGVQPTGTISWAGNISGSVAWQRSAASAGTGNKLQVYSDNDYTGDTLLSGGWTALYDGGKLSGTSNIILSYGSIFTLDNGFGSTLGTLNDNDRLKDTANIVMHGGWFQVLSRPATVSTERTGVLSIASGLNHVDVRTAPGTANTMEVTFASLDHTGSTGVLVFDQGSGTSNNTGQIGSNARIYFTTPPTLGVGNIIGGWAIAGITTGGTGARDFAAYDTALGVGSLLTPGFAGYSSNNLNTSTSSDNVRIVNTATTLTADRVANVLSYQFGAAAPLNLGGFKLTLASGGLIIGHFVDSTPAVISNGTLTAGDGASAADLYIHHLNYGGTARTSTISAVVADNTVTGPVRFILSASEGNGTTHAVTLSGLNTYTGGTVFNQGQTNLNGVGVVIPNATVPANGLILNAAGVTMLTTAGQIGSSNIVTLNGNSTLTLVGANTLAGLDFNLDGGSNVGGTVALGTSGTLTLTGGITAGGSNPSANATISHTATSTLNLGGNFSFSMDVDTFKFNGQNIAPLNRTLSITVPITNGGIVKTGDGLLSLGAANTFIGGVDLAEGGIIVADNAGLGVAGSSTLTISGNNTTLTSDGAAHTVAHNVVLGNSATSITLGTYGASTLALNGPITWSALSGVNRTLTVNATTTGGTTFATQTLGGVITTAGTGNGIVKEGIGTLAITANNSLTLDWTGSQAVKINNGTLQINADTALGMAPVGPVADNIVINGGVLGFTASGTLHVNRGITVGPATIGTPPVATVGAIDVAASQTVIIPGTISSVGGAGLLKTSTGTLTASGVTSLAGELQVFGGTMNLTNATAPTFGGLNVAGGATLNLVNGVGQSINLGAGALNLGAGTGVANLGLEAGSTSNYDNLTTSAALIARSVNFNITGLAGFGAGTYNLLNVGSNGTAGTYTFVFSGTAAGFAITPIITATTVGFTSAASPGGNFYWTNLQNDGKWNTLAPNTLASNWSTDSAGTIDAHNYPGPTTTVNFSASAFVNATTTLATTLETPIAIDNLVFNNNATSTAPATVTAITIGPGAAGTLTIAPASSSTGITLNTGAPAAVTISAPVILGASQTWSVADAATVLNVTGAITGGASNSLTKEGSGILQMTGASGINTYSGPTTIANGILRVGVANGLAANSAFTVGATGTLRMNGFNAVVGSLAGSVGAIVDNNTATAVVLIAGANNTSTNFQGNIINGSTGSMGLTKVGTGALTLSGANTYTGSTTVNTTVGNTSTLNLTGSIIGNTTTSTFAYGGTAGNTVVNISGTLTNFITTGANVAGSVAVLNQTAGIVTIIPPNSQDQQYLANNGGYGMLNITGGTFNTGRFDGVGGSGTAATNAVIYVGGTGATLNQNVGDYFLPIRKNGNMEMTIGPGGSFTRQAAVTNVFSIGGLDGTNSYAIFNVAGGSVDTGPARGISFSGGFSPGTGNVAFVNAAGGTLSLGANTTIGSATGSTNAYFNFAGATVKANATLTGVIPASTANYVITSTLFGPITNNNNANTAFNTAIGTTSNFTGGLTVNTNGFAVSFTNPLLAATGFGVTQADIGDVSALALNSGYIGAPMVKFSAPAAAGADPASGYAVIDAATGKVTGIVITNPGVYASGETPTITLSGGGGTIAPFTTSALATGNVSGGLTKIGANTLTLSGTSTFTGPLTISGGTVASATFNNIGVNGPLGRGVSTNDATNAASIVLDGGILSYTGTVNTTDRLVTVTQNGGEIDSANATAANTMSFTNTGAVAYTGPGPRTLALGGANTGTNVFAPIIGNAGADAVTVSKLGAGTWKITNASNSYTGGTNIGGGVLIYAGPGTLGTTGNITFTGTSTLRWDTGITEDLSPRLVLANAVTGTIDTNGNNVTFANGIGTTGGTSGALNKTGAGALTLNGAASYTGGTTLTTGTLNIGNAGALGSGPFTIATTGVVFDNTSGGPLTLSPAPSSQAWNGDFTFTGTNSLDMGTGPVTLGAARTVTTTANTLTVGGAISGLFALTKAGAGTLYLSSNSSTYGVATGSTININGGVLKVDSEAGLGNVLNDVTFGTGPNTLQVTTGFNANAGKVFSFTNLGIVQVDAGTMTINSALTGTANTTGGLIKTGAGTLALAAASTAYDSQGAAAAGSGATGVGFRVDAGTLLLQGGNNVVGDINPNTMTMQMNGGNISIQSDTASIARANLWVSAVGTLTADNATAGPGITQAIGTGTGTQLTMGTGSSILNVTSGANVTSGTEVVQFGATTFLAAPTFNITNPAGATTQLTLGAVTAGAFTGTFTGNGNFTQTGIWAGTGGITTGSTYSGVATLSQANTYSGLTTVNGGKVSFSTSGNLGDASATNDITLGGGTLQYTGAGALSLTANRQINLTTGTTSTVEVTQGTATLQAVGGIVTSGAANLTKTGLGALAVTGTVNLNGGGVTVSGGTLTAGLHSTNTGTIAVITGGSLQLVDSAAVAITLSGTGAGALTLSGGARLGLELAGSGVNDSITVVTPATAVASGVITLDFYSLAGFGVGAGSYTLLTAPSGLTAGGASYALGNAPAGFNYVINAIDTAVTLTTSVLSNIYWTNSQGTGSWNTVNAGPLTNFSTNLAGTTNYTMVPQPADTVIFSASTVTTSPVNTTLDAAFTVDSLRFTAQPAGATVSIAPGTGGTLNLSPVSTANGITVDNNGGAVTISAPLTAGTAQTWSVDGTGTSSLTVSGNLTYTAGVTKTGAGAVTLSGTNSGAGGFTLTGGTLNIGSASALGTGTFTIGTGTTFTNSTAGPLTLSTNNLQNWNGSFTFGGTQNLTFNGGASNAVTLGANLTATVSNTLTIGGAIGDGVNTYSLAKAGAGTLVLNGNNTYGGLTNLTAGTLTLAGDNSGAAGGVTVAGSTTLNINNDGALGTGAFTINGGTINNTSGSLKTMSTNPLQFWNGSFTFTGSNALDLGTGAVTLGTTPTVTVSASTLTVGGGIDGPFGLTKAGAGTLTLTGLSATAGNNYGGTTIIDGGILNITHATTATLSGGLTFGATLGATTAGTLNLSAGSATFTDLTAQTNSATPNTITIGVGEVLTINGNVILNNNTDNGATRLTMSGGGDFLVNGASFTVGRNTVGTDNSSEAHLNMAGLGSFTATLSGAFTQQLQGDNSATDPTSVILSNGANSIIAGSVVLGASSTGSLNTLTLGTGTNVIRTALIHLGSGVRDAGQINFAGAGGSVTMRDVAGTGRIANVTLGVSSAQGTGYTTANLIDVTGHSADIAIGTLSTSLGAKTAANTNDFNFNTGTLDIRTINMAVAKGTGASINKISIGGGTVILGGSAAFGDTGTGSVTLATAGSGELSITGGTVTSSVTIGRATGSGTAILTLNGASAVLDMSGGGVVHDIGSATNVINTFTYTNGTLRNIGIVYGGITLAGTGARVFDETGSLAGEVRGIISGAGIGLTKSGTGTIKLAGTAANTYSGLTTVSDGTLALGKTAGVDAIVGDPLSAGKTPRDILVSGGTLRWDASNQVGDSVSLRMVSGTVNFNNFNETFFDLKIVGGTVNFGTGTVVVTDPDFYTGSIINVNGPQTLDNLNIHGGAITVYGTAGPGGGPGTLTVGGASGLSFIQNKAYMDGESDPILASPSDINLTLNSDNATAGTLMLNGNVTFDADTGAGAPVTFDSSASITSGGNAANPGVVDLGGATRTFTIANSTAANDMLISARVTNGGLTKAGAGTMVLSAANPYTGATTVNGGTLVVTGSLSGTTAVTVNTGGTLLMNGGSNNVGTGAVVPVGATQTITGGPASGASFTSNVSGNNGTLAVATGAGGSGTTHTFSSMTLTNGTNTILDFSSGGLSNNTNVNLFFGSMGGTTAADLASGASTLTINNWSGSFYSLGATTDNGSFGDGQDRLLFTTDPGFTLGSIINGINFAGFGQGIEVSFGTGAGTMYEIVPVPEPATTALIGSVALCALIGYRERRRFAGTRCPAKAKGPLS